MIITSSNGHRKTVAKNLGVTTYVTLATATNSVMTLESLVAACDGTPTAFTLVYSYNGNDYFIANAVPITANSAYFLSGHSIQMAIGGVLKVKASIVDHISVTAVIIDMPPVQSSGFGSNSGVPAGAVR